MDDLFEAVASANESSAVCDSGDELESLLATVERAKSHNPKNKYQQRSALLCEHAREIKALKNSAQKSVKNLEHNAGKVAGLNKQHAVRPADKVALDGEDHAVL